MLGAHPNATANPPEDLWPDKPGPGPGWTDHASFYFRRVEQLRQIMIENGDARKQIWPTESGWSSMDPPAVGFEYAAQNSEQQQADYIGRAFRMARDQYPCNGPDVRLRPQLCHAQRSHRSHRRAYRLEPHQA